jgi:hypothetical protein
MYRIYNTVKKEFQFPQICEPTKKAAEDKLFKLIGHDARKWRFEIREVTR